MKNWQRHAIAVLVPLLVFAYATRAWWMPGLISGDDFWGLPPRSSWMLAHTFPWPSLWDPTFGLGVDLSEYLPYFPVWSICGALAHLGFGWNAIERIVFLYPLTFAIVIAPYCLIYRLTAVRTAAASGALICSLNTWTVGLVQRGHIPSLIAFSLIPFALVSLMGLERVRVWRAVGFSLIVAGEMLFDIRYAYITFVLAAGVATVWVLTGRSEAPKRASVALANGLVILATNAVLGIYWVVPALYSPAGAVSSVLSGQAIGSLPSFATVLHAATLYFPFYHYVAGSDPFAVTSVEIGFYALGALALCGLFVTGSRRLALGVLLAAGAAVVLIADSNSSFGPLVSWTQHHIPGMQMFRDTTKFYSIVALAYAVAIGFFVKWLLQRSPGRSLSIVATVLLWCGYLALMRASFDPGRGSNFATLASRPQDLAVASLIASQRPYERTLFIPEPPLALENSLEHPILPISSVVALFPPADPSASLRDYLRSPALPELLSQANVGRVILSDDNTGYMFRRFGFVIQYQRTLALLRTLPWLRESGHYGRYVVFDALEKPAGGVVAATTPALLRGDPSNLTTLATSRLWHGHPGIVDLAASRARLSASSVARFFPNLADGLEPLDAAATNPTLADGGDAPYRVIAFPAPAADGARARFTTRGAGAWRAVASLAHAPGSSYVVAVGKQTVTRKDRGVELFPSRLNVSLDINPAAVIVAARGEASAAGLRYEMDVDDGSAGHALSISGTPTRRGDVLSLHLFDDLAAALPSKSFPGRPRLYPEDFTLRSVRLYAAHAMRIQSVALVSAQAGEHALPIATRVSVPSAWSVSPAQGIRLSRSVIDDGREYAFTDSRRGAGEVASVAIPIGLQSAQVLAFDVMVSARVRARAWFVAQDERRTYLFPAVRAGGVLAVGSTVSPAPVHVVLAISAAREGSSVPRDAVVRGIRLEFFTTDAVAAGTFGVRRVTATDIAPMSCPAHVAFVLDASRIALNRSDCSSRAASDRDLALAPGSHTIGTVWDPLVRTVTLELERGNPVTVPVAALGQVTYLGPGAIEVPVRGPATLVMLPQQFEPGWTGTFAGADARGVELPHVRANGAFNAWIFDGGRGRLVFVYAPDEFSRRCALASFALFAVELLMIVGVRRLRASRSR